MNYQNNIVKESYSNNLLVLLLFYHSRLVQLDLRVALFKNSCDDPPPSLLNKWNNTVSVATASRNIIPSNKSYQ